MANTIVNHPENTFVIRLSETDCELTTDELIKRVDPRIVKHHNWSSPALKFVSFKAGVITFMNTSEKRSFLLRLQVSNNDLLVGCDCGQNNTGNLCGHAFKALDTLVWRKGRNYFQKLQPGGLFELAFAHKKHFDKKEDLRGLEVEPKPELQSVFRLNSPSSISVNNILDLPGIQLLEKIQPNEGLAYLVVVSLKNRLLPALLPCIGKLNKAASDIKTFYPYISGIQKEYSYLLTAAQKEMNGWCHSLWNMVEKGTGHILNKEEDPAEARRIAGVFDTWRKLIPALQQQQFVYVYQLYWEQELKRKPEKRRALRINISRDTPVLRFVLVEKTDFYRLEMDVLVNGRLLPETEYRHTFFYSSPVQPLPVGMFAGCSSRLSGCTKQKVGQSSKNISGTLKKTSCNHWNNIILL